MERTGLPGAARAFADASDAFPDDALVQLGLLESRARVERTRPPSARRSPASAKRPERTRSSGGSPRSGPTSRSSTISRARPARANSRGSPSNSAACRIAPPTTRACSAWSAIAYDSAGSASEAVAALRKARPPRPRVRAGVDPCAAPGGAEGRGGRSPRRSQFARPTNPHDTDPPRASRTARSTRAIRGGGRRPSIARPERGPRGHRGVRRGARRRGAERTRHAEQARTLFEAGDSADAAASGVRILTRAGRPGDAVEPYLAARVPIEGEAVRPRKRSRGSSSGSTRGIGRSSRRGRQPSSRATRQRSRADRRPRVARIREDRRSRRKPYRPLPRTGRCSRRPANGARRSARRRETREGARPRSNSHPATATSPRR
jgi:hypothetical protein